MLAAHGVTDTGSVRPHNEDTILTDVRLGLFIVADGMGGVNAGEVASRLAVDAIHDFIERSVEERDDTWPFGLDRALTQGGNRVRTAVMLANAAVHRTGEQQEHLNGMGTTVAVLLIDERSASICGVGDSRVYLVRRGRLTQLTTDHTWVETIRSQDPTIEPEVLARHPMRHVLTSVVGGDSDLDVTVLEQPLETGDRLVMCSDGVYRGVSDDLLRELATKGTPQTAAQAILDAALDLDGRDNVSAIVIEVTA